MRKLAALIALAICLSCCSFAGVNIADSGNIIVQWMSSDRVTLLGYTYATLKKSTDGGATWTSLHNFTPTVIECVRSLDNGELLVSMQTDGVSVPGALWVSTGYPTIGASATWTKTLDAGGGFGAHFTLWGLSAYQNIVVASEYGVKTPTNKGRYAWLSTDYGMHFTQIYDVGIANGSHLHGIAYDPWWGAIWLANGDVPYTDLHVSFDMGATWQEVPNVVQYTSIIALPNCILLLTDGSPNGVYRITRGTYPAFTGPTLVYTVDAGAGVNYIGAQPYQWRQGTTSQAIGETILPFLGNIGYSGLAVGTFDGITFTRIWTDTITYPADGQGLRTLVGPTITQMMYGDLWDAPVRQTNNSRLTILPASISGGNAISGGASTH